VSRWEKALRRLEQTQAAKIAIAEGICSGPALEVLLTSDYRISEPGLRVDVPVNNDSVWAGMVVHRLVSQFGGTRARQLVLFGAEFSAERALAIGLIDETADDPTAAAVRLAERFSRVAPAELAIRRRLVLDAGVTSFEEALGMHLAACARTLRRHGGEPASTPALR
jgi:isomerase DpgB